MFLILLVFLENDTYFVLKHLFLLSLFAARRKFG